MKKVDVTAYIEKKDPQFEGICLPSPCLNSITSSDMGYSSRTDPNSLGGTDLNLSPRKVMITAPICKTGDQCEKTQVIAYILPKDKTAVDCLFCKGPCDELEASESAVSIPGTPAGYKDEACVGECIKKIKWSENYETASKQVYNDTSKLYELKEYKRSVGTITMEVDIPEICGLTELRMSFEISPCFAIYDLTKQRGQIPASNALERTHGGKWEHKWDFNLGTACFFPGEYMTVKATIPTSMGTCKELIVADGWFETKCLTSAVIQGAGIVKDIVKKVEKEHLYASYYGRNLKNKNIKNLKVWDYTKTKQYRPYATYTENESLGVLTTLHLKYKDIANVKVMTVNGHVPFTGSDYSVDTTTGKLTIPSKSSIRRYSYIYVEYDRIERVYDVDEASGVIKLPQNSRGISAGQSLYVDYEYVESTVVAGGYLVDCDPLWIGNVNLHWLVSFKGMLFWVKCSDFVKWKIGDRVMIAKGGIPKTAKTLSYAEYRTATYAEFDQRLKHKNIIDFKAYNSNKTRLFIINKDYTLDRESGGFQMKSGGGMSYGQWLLVEYTYSDESAIEDHKCRNGDDCNQTPEEDILTDGAVSYTLDRTSDIILPYETGISR